MLTSATAQFGAIVPCDWYGPRYVADSDVGAPRERRSHVARVGVDRIVRLGRPEAVEQALVAGKRLRERFPRDLQLSRRANRVPFARRHDADEVAAPNDLDAGDVLD